MRGSWLRLAALGIVGSALAAWAGLGAGGSSTSFPVEGTFILWDDFPAFAAGDLCDAKRSLYHDINSDTRVRAETLDGAVLASTTLGDGRIVTAAEFAELSRTETQQMTESEAANFLSDISLQPCVFEFRLDLVAGSDRGAGYVVVFGRRGSFRFSETELREPGALQLSVGLR